MHRILLILTLAAAAAPTQAQEPKQAVEVPPSEPVIIIHGLCDSHSQTAKTGSCSTVVTRQQFETVMAVVKATSRTAVPAVPFSVAQGYSDLLVYGDAGKKAGVEKDPRFEQVLETTRLRALGDMYRLQREEQAQKASPGEIQAYYQKNLASFEELRIRRFFLPRNNTANLQDLDFRAKATQLAKNLRERAAKGEDMEKLQKEGFTTLGVKTAPETLMAPLRRGELDAKAELEVFALKPGQVSTVMEIPSVYIVYKLESRKMLPLKDVEKEISGKLYREKLENLTEALTESVHVDYNKEYFGPSASSPWVSAGSPAPQKTVTAFK